MDVVGLSGWWAEFHIHFWEPRSVDSGWMQKALGANSEAATDDVLPADLVSGGGPLPRFSIQAAHRRHSETETNPFQPPSTRPTFGSVQAQWRVIFDVSYCTIHEKKETDPSSGPERAC